MKISNKIKSIILSSVMATTLIITTGCTTQNPQGFENIDGESAEKIILKENGILVLDVRTPEEYEEGHIKNGVNISVDELENRLDEISQFKDKEVFVYCKASARSEEASKILVNNGFEKITNMEDGVSEYEYELYNYTNLTATQALELVNQNENAVILDVRDAKDYEQGHIENAINIPLDELENRLGELNKNDDIIVYCFVSL